MKLGMVGYYGDENTPANGQTLRTKSVSDAIKKYGECDVCKTMSYHDWKKHPIKIMRSFLKLFSASDVLILFPDENAVKVLLPLTNFLNRKHQKKVYYVVIGGWLPKLTKKYTYLQGSLNQLNGIFVQTEKLKTELEKQSIQNIDVFPNFRELNISDREYTQSSDIFSLCFASRVTLQKGIFELIRCIQAINQENVIYHLDIYGPIDKEIEKAFFQIMDADENLSYKGVYESSQASNVLSDYYMQVLPTKFKTEGFPGSILDSFYAGLPVLVSRWNSCENVVKENYNALIYEFDDTKDLYEKLSYAAEHPDIINAMRENCRQSAKAYLPENVIQILLNKIAEDVR